MFIKILFFTLCALSDMIREFLKLLIIYSRFLITKFIEHTSYSLQAPYKPLRK